MSNLKRLFLGIFAMLLFVGVFPALSQELVIYSGRSERLIKPVLDEFSKRTGVKITIHSGGSVELLNKILAEGDRTPADLFMTVDAGTLERARVAGLLEAIKSQVIENNIPKELRAPDNSWVGLSLRLRVIAYNPQRVKPNEIKTYDDLTNPKWKGRIGVRTGSNVYVQSQVAMMIAERGEAKTEKFLRALLVNVGDKIYPSDTRLVEAVAKGEIDVALVNHYYVYLHLNKNPEDKKNLAFVVPPKAHYNVSGIGILKTSKNKELAKQLVEFLVSDEAQKMFAEANFEYPANPKVPTAKEVLPRDKFTLSPIPLSVMGRYMVPAIDLIDKVGYR